MSIIKNEIPLLEYDSDTSAVIMPGHEGLDMVLPEKAVYAFLGEEINRYAMDPISYRKQSSFRSMCLRKTGKRSA